MLCGNPRVDGADVVLELRHGFSLAQSMNSQRGAPDGEKITAQSSQNPATGNHRQGLIGFTRRLNTESTSASNLGGCCFPTANKRWVSRCRGPWPLRW
jgi:hypothetical protein